MDKLWKKTERELARRLGGRRVPVTGRSRGDAPDIEHEWLSIEVKQRKDVPNWIRDALDQAVKSSSENKLPIVVIHRKNDRHDNDVVIIRLKDFEDWFVS